MSNLIPCPFCWGEAKIVYDPELHYYVGVCKKCNAHSAPRLTAEYAAQSWNTRFSEPLVDTPDVAPDTDVITCKSAIEFGDDYGDNVCTFHCELEDGHPGAHVETGLRGHEPYALKWSGDPPHREPISADQTTMESAFADALASKKGRDNA